MTKNDLNNIIEAVNDIKNISNNLEYNVSSVMNQNIIRIIPIIKEELDRMDKSKVDINCPAIEIVSSDDNYMSLSSKINDKLIELVKAKYKIIDFGLLDNRTAYIKYTT